MLLVYRICKEEVILDFYSEVKKVEGVKVRSRQRQAAAPLKDTEVFLMVTLGSRVPSMPRPPQVASSGCILVCHFSEGRG